MDQKNITKEEIEGVIEEYYKKYKLPKENISNNEWNTLYDVLEKYFSKKNIMHDYNTALNIIIRKALYYASFKDETEFSMKHILRALEDLVAFKIYETEINEIRKEIKNSLISKEDKLRKLLSDISSTYQDEDDIKPDISEEEWFIAFDVIEVHFRANNIMSSFYDEIGYYITSVFDCANDPNYHDDKYFLLASKPVYTLTFQFSYKEDEAIKDEIQNRLNKIKGKSYVKSK